MPPPAWSFAFLIASIDVLCVAFGVFRRAKHQVAAMRDKMNRRMLVDLTRTPCPHYHYGAQCVRSAGHHGSHLIDPADLPAQLVAPPF